MRPPSPASSYYRTPRTPSAAAPWPEPPCPKHMKTFEYFPFLPYAARERIWLLSLPGPRVVEIQYAHKRHQFRSPIPTILHVSREARTIALTQYETAAGLPLDDIDSALGHHYLTFVNFALDTFCPSISLRSLITGEWKAFLRTVPNCEKIERFGLPKRCFQFPSGACIQLLLRYTSLRDVMVLADPCIDHHPAMDGGIGKGWFLGPGEMLPTMETFGRGEKDEILENYSIEFMDKVRKAWRAEHEWDLEFVYKGVCWGGSCWVENREDARCRERKGRKVVRKMISMPRRRVAKVMTLVT